MGCPYCNKVLRVENYLLERGIKTLCCGKDIIVKKNVSYSIHPLTYNHKSIKK